MKWFSQPPEIARMIPVCGLLSFALVGLGYGLLLCLFPQFKIWEVNLRLRRPHMDGIQTLSDIHSVLYETPGVLISRRIAIFGLTGGILGCVLGILLDLGAGLKHLYAHWRGTAVSSGRGSLEVFVGCSLILSLCMFTLTLLPPAGRVYFEKRNQFEWLRDLGSTDSTTRQKAVTALGELLLKEKFYCRTTVMEALSRLGNEAAPAIPALEHLCQDETPAVRDTANTSLAKVKAAQTPVKVQE